MKFSDFSRYALSSCVAAALLVGCGGSQPPISALGAMPQSTALVTHAVRGKSWMDDSATGHDLMYATDGVAKVYVYTYPQGRHVGTLTGFTEPMGECVDTSGDIYVVSQGKGTEYDRSAIITEYAHGGTQPIKTLTAGLIGSSCAIDSVRGILAVAGSWDDYGTYSAAFALCGLDQSGSCNGEGYYTNNFNPFSMCGYDAKGNLYLSTEGGTSPPHEEYLVRLPADYSEALEQISVNASLFDYNGPVSVQWDGKYVTVSSFPDHSPARLYRLRISGSSATVVGSTTLRSSNNTYTSQVWIQGKAVVVGDYFKGRDGVDQWAYPDATKPRRVVPNSIHPSYGLVVSVAAR
jgi:hypothetical protein